MKVFISYNHKDQHVALKIKDELTANGFEVLIDAEKMRTGQDIEQFIFDCIRESGTTLSLISVNSLMSAWVTMETVTSKVDARLRERYFLPCYIDEEFFDRRFAAKALEKMDDELNEITALMKNALDKGWGIEDLQSERTRYNKMKVNLPEIIGQLRNTLCVDLTPGNFQHGMQKIIADLRMYPTLKEKEAPIKEKATEAIGALKNMIDGSLDELAKQRLAAISKRLSTLQELLDKYEQELDFETDPKKQLRYQREVEGTKASIQKALDEIKSM